MIKRYLHIAFLMLLCLFIYVPSSYAAPLTLDDLPSIPTELYGYSVTDYFVYYDSSNSNYYVHLFGDSTDDGNISRIKVTSSVSGGNRTEVKMEDLSAFYWDYRQYNKSTGEWYPGYSSPQYRDGIMELTEAIHTKEVLYSTVDLYTSNGDVFFTPPPTNLELYQIIQGVATEEIQNQNQTLAGTMRILTVCGVGLIALLIGLVLFGKLFRIFRVR